MLNISDLGEMTMTITKTYIKAHYNDARGLYSDLEWLTDGYEIINIFDNRGSVTVVYKV